MEKGEATATTTAGEKPRRTGLKRFFLDFWWAHLIALVVIVLVVILPVVYVAYPKIAQDQVNDSGLTITRMSITKPRPDGFVLNLTAELSSDTSFHPSLKAWNGSLFLPNSNESYLTLEIPEFTAKDGAETNIDSDVTLDGNQLEPFTDFVKTLLAVDNVTSFLIGKGNLKLGGLPTTSVDYNKTLEMGGFGGLQDIKLSDSRLLADQPDNATLAGKVTIPNPSAGAVELGDLTFALSIPAEATGSDGPTALGTATVNNTFLEPNQDNIFDIRSVADQNLVLDALQKNQTLLTSGLPLTIVARKVEYNGQVIPWLTSALSSAPIQQTLNISELLN